MTDPVVTTEFVSERWLSVPRGWARGEIVVTRVTFTFSESEDGDELWRFTQSLFPSIPDGWTRIDGVVEIENPVQLLTSWSTGVVQITVADMKGSRVEIHRDKEP